MTVNGPQMTALHRLAEKTLEPRGAWGLCTRVCSYLFGASISKKILPSQTLHDDDFINESKQLEGQFERKLATLDQQGITATKFKLRTYDNATLESIELKHPNQEQKDPYERHYVICLVGNGMCYQDLLRDMLDDCKNMQYNVLSFNYRNVLESNGTLTSQVPLILDLISQIERLKQQGIKPENIHLLGHSFGAAIATITASIYHLYGEQPDLVNGRSLSTAAEFVYFQHPEGLQRLIWGNLDRLKLALTNLNLNPVLAYSHIPVENKRYFYVKKVKTRNDSKPDGVIDHQASFHKGLKNTLRTNPGLFFAHNPLTTGQKVLSFNRMFGFGHNDPTDLLQLPNGTNARDLYRQFFTRRK